MATRQLAQIIDRETGDVNNLRDKLIADQTTGNSSTAGNFVIKGTDASGNEAYFNVSKADAAEFVRNALGSLMKNNVKADAPYIPVIDSANDLGSMTPANLAPVLFHAGWKRSTDKSIMAVEGDASGFLFFLDQTMSGDVCGIYCVRGAHPLVKIYHGEDVPGVKISATPQGTVIVNDLGHTISYLLL